MSFINKQKNLITILQIDNTFLRLIQVDQSQAGKKISTIKLLEIGSLIDDEIAKEITSLAGRLKINPHYLIISIPRHLITTRNLELPSANPLEIKGMIELQIGKQTPYASEEIIWDYQILGSNADGYSRVQLVIVHRDVIERYSKILATAGLKGPKVGFSSEGLLNWSRLIEQGKAPSGKAQVLIEVDYDTSDFEIILDDKLVFGRSLSVGFSQLPGQLEEWQKKFVQEVNHSIYVYQTEVLGLGKEISKIIISKPEMVGDSLEKSILEKEFGLPVEVVDQLKNISLTEEAVNAYAKIVRTDVSFSALAGLALAFGEQKINLIPQEQQISKVVQEKGKDLYLMGIFLVFILVAVSGIFLGRTYNKERYLGQITKRLSEIQNKTKELTGMIRAIETIKERVFTRGLALNLIYEVHQVISPEIHLVSMSFDGKEFLILRGESNMMSEVFIFITKLEESGYFRDVKSKYATKRMVEGKEITEFEISCSLENKYKITDKYKL